MAVTGLVLVGFVIAHMAGNLQSLRRPASDQRVRGVPAEHAASCCGSRGVVLLVAVVLHVVAGVPADAASSARRGPIGYAKREPQVVDARVAHDAVGRRRCCSSSSSSTSCTSRSGTVVQPGSSMPARDVYGNVVAAFRIWWVVAVLRRRDGRSRPAPLPRRVELAAHARPDASRRAIRCTRRVARGHRRASCGSDSSIVPIARARSELHPIDGHEARRAKSRPARSSEKWDKHKFEMKLVNPANKRKYDVIVVGAGLAGGVGGGDARRARLQRQVLLLPGLARGARTRSPRRAASTPRRTTRTTATAFTGCSTTRSRAATSARAKRTCYRLAEVSVNIIDQCVAQGVPFAREYGGLLANRSFGGAQVSRTFYARGQTGQQLLLGAYSGARAADRARARCKMFPRTEMLDLVVVDGRARGIVARDLVTGEIESHAADAVVLGDRRLRQRLLPLDECEGLQRHGDLARVQARRRASRIRASRRSIRRASRSAATTSRSSR